MNITTKAVNPESEPQYVALNALQPGQLAVLDDGLGHGEGPWLYIGTTDGTISLMPGRARIVTKAWDTSRLRLLRRGEKFTIEIEG